jgi:signal transduction histidine kinase
VAALGGGGCVAVLVLAVAVAGDALPRGRSASPSAFAGGPVVVALQLSAALLYATSAAGFSRRADRTGDGLIRWLAIACVLAAFSRVNYLVPTALVAGDALRLAFFLALLVAGVSELRCAERALFDAAALEERRRIARDIHDGMAQDLAFIVQQARALRRRLGPTPVVERIVDAAQRALDESRDAVTTLMRPTCQPLSEALAQTAREVGEREGSIVEAELPSGVSVPAPTQEVMVRVVREAVTNAARHGAAHHIKVELRDDPQLCLSVSDDGRGFDPAEAAAAPGHFGLRGMADRVRGIGGELSIDSEPGRGTLVRVVVE